VSARGSSRGLARELGNILRLQHFGVVDDDRIAGRALREFVADLDKALQPGEGRGLVSPGSAAQAAR
jgi:hypothetical protein